MNSLLLKSAGFLVFETIVILAFKAFADDGSDSMVAFILVMAAAALGYGFLGASAGWRSVIVVFPPILIAYVIEPTSDGEASEGWTLAGAWAFYSLVAFLPSWLFGLFVHSISSDTSEDPT